MLCEVLLSSLWFLFVIFWVETISVWLFVCIFYQERAFYHWGDGIFTDDQFHMLYTFNRVDASLQRHGDMRKEMKGISTQMISGAMTPI